MNRICQLSAVQALKFVPVEAGESAIRIMLDTGEGGTKPGRFALLFVVVMLMMLMMLMMLIYVCVFFDFCASVRAKAQHRAVRPMQWDNSEGRRPFTWCLTSM